jgi:tetratricopeptide (TPR) repeat protein
MHRSLHKRFLIVFVFYGIFSFAAVPKTIEKARIHVLTENFSEALAIYSPLAKSSSDPEIISEYAYVLALTGVYDLALQQIDRVWNIGKTNVDVNYYSAQVFYLMGYNDVGDELWKSLDKQFIPSWIAKQAPVFLEKHKSLEKPITPNEEEFLQLLDKANELADRNNYFQSIAIFHQLIGVYPAEYFPYVYYSITLEKAGATNKAIQMMDVALKKIGSNQDDSEKRALLEERRLLLLSKVNTAPNFFSIIQAGSESPPRILFYVGGQVSSIFTNVNLRTGYLFKDNKYNINVDLGLFNDTSLTSSVGTSVGMSAYRRLLLNSRESKNQGFLVGGIGIQKITNKNIAPHLTFGFSFVNNKRLSLDLLYNIYSEKIRTFLIGETFYF